MNKEKCITCLFGGMCCSIKDCDYYSPLDDDEAETNRYIEDRRREFYEDWARYTTER